jgi:hypothetical protein
MRALGFAAAAAVLLAGVAPSTAQTSAAAPAPAADPDPRNLALAREIIDISYPAEGRNALLANRINTIMAQARAGVTELLGEDLGEEGQQIYDRYFGRIRDVSAEVIAQHSPALFEAYSRAYARIFTYDELVQIRAFAVTPAGRQFFLRSNRLSSDPDAARAGVDFGSAYATAVMPAQRQFDEELRAYAERRQR